MKQHGAAGIARRAHTHTMWNPEVPRSKRGAATFTLIQILKIFFGRFDFLPSHFMVVVMMSSITIGLAALAE